MKKFIYVFVILLSINIIVPAVYHHIYSNEFSDIISPAYEDEALKEPFTDTDNHQEVFQLYNLETETTDEFELIPFLIGSAACEMPASYEPEAIKAQMIACHSYYLYCKKNGVPDDSMNLSYNERNMTKYASADRLKEFWGDGFKDNYEKFRRCAEEVKNMIVTYQGNVALTTYYAVSCGTTQSAENEWGSAIDYLVPVDSPKDALSDNYLKIKTYSVQEMYDRFMLNFAGLELDMEHPEEWIGNINYNQSGYVDTMEIYKSKIRGKDFREYFELRSACFMVFYEDDTFSIATKGYGHGVGLSQFGANQLALEGKNFKEILNHYFPGTKTVSTDT